VAVLIGTLGLLVVRVGARRSQGLGEMLDSVRSFALPFAAAVAVACMAGSLYFSEVAGFVPCTLCWYQRIAMYSLAVILTVAAVRRDLTIRWYALPLAGIGIVISTYHWLLERFPELDAGACSSTIPCEFIWFERFGFVTLPFMAFTGFAAVIALLTIPAPVPAPSLSPGGSS
jgi:disulfide bond formation protein DsbB